MVSALDFGSRQECAGRGHRTSWYRHDTGCERSRTSKVGLVGCHGGLASEDEEGSGSGIVMCVAVISYPGLMFVYDPAAGQL